MPSELHNMLAKLALRWLHNKVTGRGLRGGFEVPMAVGYVVDAAAICCLQQRFAETYIGEEYFERPNAFTLVVPEVVFVFEAKATRSDFLSTFGNGPRHENRKSVTDAVAHFHYCVCPHKVAKPEELPPFWGLLQTRGAGLGVIRRAEFCDVGRSVVTEAAYNILWYAKYNHSRFARSIYDELEH